MDKGKSVGGCSPLRKLIICMKLLLLDMLLSTTLPTTCSRITCQVQPNTTNGSSTDGPHLGKHYGWVRRVFGVDAKLQLPARGLVLFTDHQIDMVR